MGRKQGVDIDEQVVMEDLRVVKSNKLHSSHIRGQRVDFIHSVCGLETIFLQSQVDQFEFISISWLEFRVFNICAAHAIAYFLKGRD
jgi:hypothetical protein